jgi:hypothetical protein
MWIRKMDNDEYFKVSELEYDKKTKEGFELLLKLANVQNLLFFLPKKTAILKQIPALTANIKRQ